MKNNKGISNLILIISVLLLILISLGSTYLYFYKQKPSQIEIKNNSKSIQDETQSNKEVEKNISPTKETSNSECATPDMFSKELAKVLKPYTKKELENISEFKYLDTLSFYLVNEGDRYFSGALAAYPDPEDLVIANKLVYGEGGSGQIAGYIFRKTNCVGTLDSINKQENNKITTLINNNNIKIYVKPGCCLDPGPSYFIEVPEEFQKRINSKFIVVFSIGMFDTDNIEKVLRTVKFLPINR